MTTFTYTTPSSDRAVTQPFPVGYGQNDELLTFRETMTRLKVSRSTLYRLMWSGQLTGHKVGNNWRFYVSDVQQTLRRQTFTQCS